MWVFQRVWASAWPVPAEVALPGDLSGASTGRVALAGQAEGGAMEGAVSPALPLFGCSLCCSVARRLLHRSTRRFLRPGAAGQSPEATGLPSFPNFTPLPSWVGLATRGDGVQPQRSSGGGDGVCSYPPGGLRWGGTRPRPGPRVPGEPWCRMSALCRHGVGRQPTAALAGTLPAPLPLTLLPPARSHL